TRCARVPGVRAPYIGGFSRRDDGAIEQEAGHAGAEAHVPTLGGVAFDPANGICATDAHVRVAVGLDYLGAAPVRGTRYGGTAETLAVEVLVDQSARQGQGRPPLCPPAPLSVLTRARTPPHQPCPRPIC